MSEITCPKTQQAYLKCIPVYRYEDNGDAVNNIAVMVRSTTKNSIEEFGSPDKFLDENKYLLGKQVFVGAGSDTLPYKYTCHAPGARPLHHNLVIKYKKLPVDFLLQLTTGALPISGETISEGGFQKDKVSVASLLDVQQAKDKKGKT
jgi:photosystem II oxygen-evolving enhancer protein 2/Niemann-Pick C1 protein